MSILPKTNEHQLPILYNLERDKVPTQLQQLQIKPMDSGRVSVDKMATCSSDANVSIQALPLKNLESEMDEINKDVATQPHYTPESDIEMETQIDSHLNQRSKVVNSMEIDEFSSANCESTSKSQSPVPINQTDAFSELMMEASLECDETYIDRSTSSNDMDTAIKNDLNENLLEDDCSSGKPSPLSVDATSEDRTSVNDLEVDEELDKQADDVDFDTSGESALLNLELVGQVIARLRKCRCRTDKPRIVRILQKTCNLSRKKVVEFLNRIMVNNQVERVRYREYYGLRLVGSGDSKDGSETQADEFLSMDQTLVDSISKIMRDHHAEKNGLNCGTIFKLLQDACATNNCSFNQIQFMLQDESDKKDGFFEEVSIGHYRIRQPQKPKPTMPRNVRSTTQKRKTPSPVNQEGYDESIAAEDMEDRLAARKSESVQRARPVSQRKKFKKSLGPDFLDPTDLKQQYAKGLNDSRCEYCNMAGPSMALVSCKKCKSCIHTRCLEKKNDRTALKRLKVNDCYLCEQCRLRCASCQKDDLKLMAICKGCKDVFHVDCITKLLNYETNFTTDWYCIKCRNSTEENNESQKSDSEKSENSVKSCSSKSEPTSILPQTFKSSSNESTDLVDKHTASFVDEEPNRFTDVKNCQNTIAITTTSEATDNLTLSGKNTDKDNTNANGVSVNVDSDNEQNSGSDNGEKQLDLERTAEQSSNEDNSHSSEDFINVQSNQSNQSIISNQSNQSNQTSDSNDKALIDEFSKLLPNYERQREMIMTKDEIEILRSLNSYSNGKQVIDWTVDDVQTFITDIGFPEQSSLFRREEIDGKSLLLLRRHDVLTGFQMQLGPALKIYAHIYKLQVSV